MKYTNTKGVSLPVAVWLLSDEYDYIDLPNYISATSLMAPIKQLLLKRRVPKELREADVADFIASSLGTAVHDSIEKAWTRNGGAMMKHLGYPAHICDNIAVNPDAEYMKLNPQTIPVWLEQRTMKEIDGFIIGGKFDMVLDGRLFDFKTTSVWSYLLGSKDNDYSLQGSIYRWLNPDKILDDHIYIEFLFTDWKRSDAKQRSDYPQLRTLEHPVEMLDEAATVDFIRMKLAQIVKYEGLPENQIPDCTPEELWQTDPQYKYYADPTKTDGRSTKNFTSLAEANKFMAEKGKGIVITIPGEVKRCAYCPAYEICEQRKRYDV